MPPYMVDVVCMLAPPPSLMLKNSVEMQIHVASTSDLKKKIKTSC